MPHSMHVVNLLDHTMDTLQILPKDPNNAVRSNQHLRRILDVCSNPEIGFFVLVQENLHVYV
jgi:hypothetical protein